MPGLVPGPFPGGGGGGYAWSGPRFFSRDMYDWLVTGPFGGEGEVGMPGTPIGRYTPSRKVRPLVLTSCGGQRKERYASYWNAFSSIKYILNKRKRNYGY